MKKTIIVLILLFVSLGLNTLISTNSQASWPTVVSASFGQTSANNGDTITLHAEISHNDEVTEVYFGFYAPEVVPGEGPIYLGGEYLSYDISSELWEGDYAIQQNDPSTLIIGEVGVGTANNYYFLNNAELFPNRDHLFNADPLSISNTTPDYLEPVLNGLFFNTSEIAPNQKLKILANVTDEDSGIDSVNLNIYRQVVNNPNTFEDEQIRPLNLFYNSTSGMFENTMPFYSYFLSGSYYVGAIHLRDNADLQRSYYVNPYADHDLDTPFVNLTNSEYVPAISDIYFEYVDVDIIPNQTLHFNISNFENFGSGFDEAGISLGYRNEQGYEEQAGFINANSEDYNSTTNYYSVQVYESEYSYFPSHEDIFVQSLHFFHINGDRYHITFDSNSRPSFQLTGNINEPFEIEILGQGENYLGFETEFDVILTNNQYFGISGNYSLEISGPENFTSEIENISFNTRNITSIVENFNFESVGTYNITAIFDADNNVTYTTSINWNVNEIPLRELTISVEPSSGISETGEEVEFEINITNTFIFNEVVQLYFILDGPEMIEYESSELLVASPTTFTSFQVQFQSPGIYEFNVTIQDQYGDFWWSETYSWEVFEEESTSEVDTELRIPGFTINTIIISLFIHIKIKLKSKKLQLI